MAAARLVPIAPFFHPELNTYLPDRVLSFTRDAVSKTLRAFRRKRVARHSPYPNDSPLPNLPLSSNPTLPLHATQHFVQEALFIGFAMNKALSIGQQKGGLDGIWAKKAPDWGGVSLYLACSIDFIDCRVSKIWGLF